MFNCRSSYLTLAHHKQVNPIVNPRVNPRGWVVKKRLRARAATVRQTPVAQTRREHKPTWGIRGAKKKIDIIFRFSLKMEYPRAYKWDIIEDPRIFNDIPFMGLPREYPYSYSPRRSTKHSSSSSIEFNCRSSYPG